MHRRWKVRTLNNRTAEILFTMLHLFPRVRHYIMEMFTPLDWQKLNLQYTDFRFVWTQKSMMKWFWYTYCLDHMNALFLKFYRFMRTTLEHWSTLTRNAAQAIPLKNLASRTGEGHSFQTLTVATLQVEKKSSVLQVIEAPQVRETRCLAQANFATLQKLSWHILNQVELCSIHGDMARHGS